MASLYLIRHGQSLWGQGDGRYCSRSDIALSPAGVAQAEALARRFTGMELRAIYTSDLGRAVATAQFIAVVHGLEVQILPELREQDFGLWEGLTEDEIVARWAEEYRARDRSPDSVAPPEGESYAEVHRRVLPVLESLLENAASDSFLVVAHKGPNRVILSHVLGVPLDQARRIHQYEACVNLIHVSASGCQVRVVNDCCHLRRGGSE